LFGLLGYALALGFDLVSVTCMLARLNAQRMRDEAGARLNLVGVLLCAAVSAFANAASSLQGYNPASLNHTPSWMQALAPWAGLIYPTLIVVLSMTADHILDSNPVRGLDVATLRERERRRVALVQLRLDTEKELLRLETELITLRRQREQASGRIRMKREWIFWRWLRPPVPAESQAELVHAIVDQMIGDLRIALEERLERLQSRWDIWRSQHQDEDRVVHNDPDLARISLVHAPITPVTTEEPIALRGEPGGPVLTQKPLAREPEGGPTEGLDLAQETTAQLILATLRRSTGHSDRTVAREVGCSKTTVARWRKRFQEQGLLLDHQKAENQPGQESLDQAG
ncbi:MAG TPA: helix-turn-helix domain-containing protein, partial [Ktedonobacteraceae bacterium]|nr:helix-turn-helix domain-containing protein [Ktedonobacteraceae bacterium]